MARMARQVQTVDGTPPSLAPHPDLPSIIAAEVAKVTAALRAEYDAKLAEVKAQSTEVIPVREPNVEITVEPWGSDFPTHYALGIFCPVDSEPRTKEAYYRKDANGQRVLVKGQNFGRRVWGKGSSKGFPVPCKTPAGTMGYTWVHRSEIIEGPIPTPL